MKTKKLKKDKVNIITLGCSKNMVDSEVLSGQLKANEIDVVHESGKKDHNIVIVNTCGFIEKAKEESINTILDQVELKKRGKLDKVYVTGCLSERYKNNLETEIPEVDAFFGTMELPQILKKFDIDYKAEFDPNLGYPMDLSQEISGWTDSDWAQTVTELKILRKNP